MHTCSDGKDDYSGADSISAKPSGGTLKTFERRAIRRAPVSLWCVAAIAGFGGYPVASAQVLPGPGISSGWDATSGDSRPRMSPTREAALGSAVRVRQVEYFDIDGDGLDDELVTTRPASEPDGHCEDTPPGTQECRWNLVFLKRSTRGWTPFDVAGDYTQTTYAWVGGFHIGTANMLVVDLRSHSEDGTGPLLTHSYALLTWRDGGLHLLHEGVSARSGDGPLYLAADPDGVRFSDGQGCTALARLRNGAAVVDRTWQCPRGRQSRRGRRR